jgi:hypothetical protein
MQGCVMRRSAGAFRRCPQSAAPIPGHLTMTMPGSTAKCRKGCLLACPSRAGTNSGEAIDLGGRDGPGYPILF